MAMKKATQPSASEKKQAAKQSGVSSIVLRAAAIVVAVAALAVTIALRLIKTNAPAGETTASGDLVFSAQDIGAQASYFDYDADGQIVEVFAVRASLLYNAGRLVSYTLIGGVLGLIGEKAAISLSVRSAIGMAAGVWMLLMGVKMLTGFSLPRRFRLTLPARVQEGLLRMSAHGSFAIGLANGLMPCGPLQSMQLYAIACGSFVSGAASMFCFCLGTVPLVLLMGAAAEWLKKSWKRRMLQFGSALLVLMGLHTLMNNLALSGVGLSPAPGGQETVAAVVSEDVQYVTTELHSNGFDSIRVQAGMPVVWTIHADAQSLNGCNNEVVVPAFGIQAKLGEGDTQLVFTPTEPGTYLYSCWMGMLKSTIVVTESEPILHSEADQDA